MIATLETNEDGFAAIQLPIGKYTYKEILAPNGYQLDDEIYDFEITEENSTLVIDVLNESIIVAAPNTNLNDTLAIVGTILAFIGLILIAIASKNNKKD